MKLKSISLKNYRSVEDITLEIYENNDNSFTYGLIGVNEAGKSSILRGFNYFNNDITTIIDKDFHDKTKPIILEYKYLLDNNEAQKIKKKLKEDPENILVDVNDFSTLSFNISLTFGSNDFENYLTSESTTKGKYLKFDIDETTNNFFINQFHNTIFWTADRKHLITDSINLSAFAANPDGISIPLKNCFKLAGIKDISERINLLTDSTERESLREELGSKVTEHIKRVWPKHPIKITFDISDGNIHFHVKDENVIGKSKTADQRSDGFKQFISFLLTLSAENINSELKNTIILLDEPETHLHPRAQEDLLKELISITKANNNIVFFATHSNYMIDKTFLNRNYKITKPKDITIVKKFDEKQSSYASVNYDVFEIASTDYHNELFGKAQELSDIEKGTDFDKKIEDLIENCPIKKNYVHTNGKKFDCTLPTYIRHLIHHPENKNNTRFTNHELDKSIIILLDFISKIKTDKKS